MGYCFCLAIHLFFGVQRRMCATQINAPPPTLPLTPLHPRTTLCI
jgi:hypothetical protein